MYDLFAHLNRPVPDYLQELLSISKKSELKKFAKHIEITKQDFVTLVWNAAALGYCHRIKPREFRPADASLDGDWNFGQSEDGKPTPETIRTIKKIRRIFDQRRLFTAHIFFNQQRWHIFYFDQRDMDASSQNQWKHGSHIHFVNDLWPNYDPQVIWNLLELAKTPIKDSLHIRYDPQETEDSSGDSAIPFPAP